MSQQLIIASVNLTQSTSHYPATTISISFTSPRVVRDHRFQMCDKFSRNYNRMSFNAYYCEQQNKKILIRGSNKKLLVHGQKPKSLLFSVVERVKKSVGRRTKSQRVNHFLLSPSSEATKSVNLMTESKRSEWIYWVRVISCTTPNGRFTTLAVRIESKSEKKSKLQQFLRALDWHDDSSFSFHWTLTNFMFAFERHQPKLSRAPVPVCAALGQIAKCQQFVIWSALARKAIFQSQMSFSPFPTIPKASPRPAPITSLENSKSN